MELSEGTQVSAQTTNYRYGPMMAAVFIGSFMVLLSSSTINIALPSLMKNFGSSLDVTKWALTGFMMTMGTTAPLAAFLGERLSYKTLFIVSILGFTGASILATLSGDIYSLIAMRCLQGLFGGVAIPATMAIIYQVLPRERQVAALALWSLAPTLGPALGPTLGGFLIQAMDWRAIFLVNLILGPLAAILASRSMPRVGIVAKSGFDWIGLVLAVAASLLLLVPCSQGAAWGWTSLATLLTFGTGIVALSAFIWRELVAKSPVLDLRVFKHPRYCLSVAITCVMNIALYTGSILTPIFLQNIQRMSALDAGLVLLPASIVMVVVMLLASKLCNRFGPVPLTLVGLALMFLGLWRLSGLTPTTTASYIRIWKAVMYAGLSLTSMPAAYAGMSILPKRQSGHGSSINNWLKQVTGSLAIGACSSLLATRVGAHVASAGGEKALTAAAKAQCFVLGLDDVYFIASVVALVGLPFALALAFVREERSDTE
jgi:drug resistance transporter, EmrB/QacA subfamily